MKKKIKVGILKETKIPTDRRVAISPKQAEKLLAKFPQVELFIQKSNDRAFADEEYSKLGLNVVDDVSMCDVLMGIKEVNKEALIPDKTYLFFSHTGKKQAHNRALLQTILRKNIRMIDYEYLVNEKGLRVVAFGRWAGLVGAYNGLIALGKRYGLYELPRAVDTTGIEQMFEALRQNVKLPPVKILLTGNGRVAGGALETLSAIDIKRVEPADFLNTKFDYPVYTQLSPEYYVQHKDNKAFALGHFFKNPSEYKSIFAPYTKVADVYMACHYWDNRSPKFITKRDLEQDDFNIKIIADVSCDVGGPIDSTVRSAKIADPFYGYNRKTHEIGYPFDAFNMTVMAVDNLPAEVARDSSDSFSEVLVDKVLPCLFGDEITYAIQYFAG